MAGAGAAMLAVDPKVAFAAVGGEAGRDKTADELWVERFWISEDEVPMTLVDVLMIYLPAVLLLAAFFFILYLVVKKAVRDGVIAALDEKK